MGNRTSLPCKRTLQIPDVTENYLRYQCWPLAYQPHLQEGSAHPGLTLYWIDYYSCGSSLLPEQSRRIQNKNLWSWILFPDHHCKKHAMDMQMFLGRYLQRIFPSTHHSVSKGQLLLGDLTKTKGEAGLQETGLSFPVIRCPITFPCWLDLHTPG